MLILYAYYWGKGDNQIDDDVPVLVATAVWSDHGTSFVKLGWHYKFYLGIILVISLIKFM